MPDSSQVLEQAYELIHQGDLLAGKNLLKPAIDANSTNPDVWWLYAHATEDAEEGRRALMRVVSLDPSYAQAGELIKKYDTLQKGADADGSSLLRPARQRTQRKPRRWLPLLLLGLVLGVAVFVILTMFNPFEPAQISPTEVAANDAIVDDDADDDGVAQIFETEEPPLVFDDVTPSDEDADPFSLLSERLIVFALVDDDAIRITPSTFGETLRVEVCAPDTANGRQQQLVDVMTALSDGTVALPEDIDGVAVALTNCDDATAIRTVGAPIDRVNALLAGEITFREFQGSWMPIE